MVNKYADYLNNIMNDEKDLKKIASIEEFMQELIWIYENKNCYFLDSSFYFLSAFILEFDTLRIFFMIKF